MSDFARLQNPDLTFQSVSVETAGGLVTAAGRVARFYPTARHRLVITLAGGAGMVGDGALRPVGWAILLEPGAAITLLTGDARSWVRCEVQFSLAHDAAIPFHWPPMAPGARHVIEHHGSGPKLARMAMRHLMKLDQGILPQRHILMRHCLIQTLLWIDHVNVMPQQACLRLEQACHWINRRLDRDLGLDVIARAVDVSPRTLTRLFSRYLGTSPMQYVEHRRIQRAGELLVSTDASIEDITRATGFDNPRYFASRFKKITGQTPSSLRRGRG